MFRYLGTYKHKLYRVIIIHICNKFNSGYAYLQSVPQRLAEMSALDYRATALDYRSQLPRYCQRVKLLRYRI